MQKVNVLGTEYTIKMDVPQEDMPLEGDGCMDHSIKEIWIADFGESDRDSIKDLDSYRKKSSATRNCSCVSVRKRSMEQ